MPQKPTVAELIAVCLDTGSETAWLELVQMLQPLIASVVLRCVRRHNHHNLSVVDDLVQDSFLRLFRDNHKALRTFVHRHETAIFGFVKVISISVANDYFRKLNTQKRSAEISADTDTLLLTVKASTQSTVDPIILLDIERKVDKVVVDPRDRMIFWSYYRQGLTASDIAALPGIGLTVKGVESCLLRLTKAVKLGIMPVRPAEGLPSSSTLGEI